ncbi:MAG: hypothetical protein V1811_03265 [Candidatus Micrarchaeota archaeon]
MSRISQQNFQRISESVLNVLFDKYPIAQSTASISREIARDNEFTLRVMQFLEGKRFVVRVSRGSRFEWKLSKQAKARYDSIV